MSTSGKGPTRREYTEGEQNESLISRRARAFADRSRDPGDATTWAVVLGSLMFTLLMFCLAVSGHPPNQRKKITKRSEKGEKLAYTKN